MSLSAQVLMLAQVFQTKQPPQAIHLKQIEVIYRSYITVR